MPDDAPPRYSGEDVRRFRESLGKNLTAFARWAGYSKAHVSKVERGLIPVPLPLCRILAERGVKPRR